MKKITSIFAIIVLTTLSFPLAAVEFTDKDIVRLQKGDTLKKPLPTSRTKGFYGGTGWALIDAPVNEVWQELQSWENYTEVFPNTVSAKELSRKGDRSLVQIKMGHKLINVIYHLNVVRDTKNYKLSFHLVTDREHDIEDTRGYWRLFPQKNGKTLVAYVVATQVPMGIIHVIGNELEKKIERHLLGIPGNLKLWIESDHQNSYNKMMTAQKGR